MDHCTLLIDVAIESRERKVAQSPRWFENSRRDIKFRATLNELEVEPRHHATHIVRHAHLPETLTNPTALSIVEYKVQQPARFVKRNTAIRKLSAHLTFKTTRKRINTETCKGIRKAQGLPPIVVVTKDEADR